LAVVLHACGGVGCYSEGAGTAFRLRARQPRIWGSIHGRDKGSFSASQLPELLWVPLSLLSASQCEIFFPVVNKPEHEADHSATCIARDKNVWFALYFTTMSGEKPYSIKW
jgi:hypothetical protein